jgi:hypothetical protein
MVRLAHVLGVTQLVMLLGLVVAAGVQGLIIGFLVGSATAVGWLLASRLPHNPLGWMLLFVGGCFALAGPAYAVGLLVEDSAPGLAAWCFWYAGGDNEGWVWLPPVGILFTQVLLRFPDGQLPSPRWRWFSRLTIGLLVSATVLAAVGYPEVRPGLPNPVYLPWVAAHEAALVPLVGLPLLSCFLGSAVSVVVRYRRAGSLERTQIRWVAWAASAVVGMYVVSLAVPWSVENVLNQAVVVMYALIPVAIGIAVMRYQLYEIDRIVSRSISYAIVTATVVGVYAMVVTSLTRLLPDAGSLSVALATLAAAAVFQPALRRVRGAVDRRFDRTAFDGLRTADEFGQSLRHEVDQDTIQRALLLVIEQTLAPSQAWIWTPPDSHVSTGAEVRYP